MTGISAGEAVQAALKRAEERGVREFFAGGKGWDLFRGVESRRDNARLVP